MEELESSSSPAAGTTDAEEPEADLDPDDTMFNSVALTLDDLEEMKAKDEE